MGPSHPRVHPPVDPLAAPRRAAPLAARAWRLSWPLPAAAAWTAGWTIWMLGQGAGVSAGAAFIVAMLVSGGVAWHCTRGSLRRAIAMLGFPLSAVALGAAAAPPWAWLALLLPLLAAYPLRAWRDAPFFPSPADALYGIATLVPAPPRRVLDVGCGLGHGLKALHLAWPDAQLHGIEWSLPLTWLARLSCRGIGAHVRHGDMWGASWRDFDLVYLFQRPESMARAFDKAAAEMSFGGWLLSLEFEVPGPAARACLRGALQQGRRRALWVYRLPPADSTARRSGR